MGTQLNWASVVPQCYGVLKIFQNWLDPCKPCQPAPHYAALTKSSWHCQYKVTSLLGKIFKISRALCAPVLCGLCRLQPCPCGCLYKFVHTKVPLCVQVHHALCKLLAWCYEQHAYAPCMLLACQPVHMYQVAAVCWKPMLLQLSCQTFLVSLLTIIHAMQHHGNMLEMEKPGTTKSPRIAAAALNFEQGIEAHSPWPGRSDCDCVVYLSYAELSCFCCQGLDLWHWGSRLGTIGGQ